MPKSFLFFSFALLMLFSFESQASKNKTESRKANSKVEMMSANWKKYENSWKVETIDERVFLLNDALSENCLYTDPNVTDLSISLLVGHVGKFRSANPGASMRTDKIVFTGNHALAQWTAVKASGELGNSGVDYVEFDSTGKIKKVVGFFKVKIESI